jgi:hypothetical protein
MEKKFYCYLCDSDFKIEYDPEYVGELEHCPFCGAENSLDEIVDHDYED